MCYSSAIDAVNDVKFNDPACLHHFGTMKLHTYMDRVLGFDPRFSIIPAIHAECRLVVVQHSHLIVYHIDNSEYLFITEYKVL